VTWARARRDGHRTNGTNGLFETTGTAAGTDQGVSSAITNLGTTGTVYPVSCPTGHAHQPL
jgi:hypothetical protein